MQKEDIAAISSLTGVDLGSYKSFDIAPVEANPVEHPEVAEAVLPAAPPLQTPVLPRLRPASFFEAIERRDSLPLAWNRHLPVASFTFRSLTGGAGVTTLQASMARALAGRAMRTLAVDSDPYQLLSQYFAGRQATLSLLAHGEGMPEPALWRAIQRHRPDVDWALLEEWRGVSEQARTILAQETTRLTVLVPDPQTAMKLRAQDPAAEAETFYVLNKFDGTVSLHREMQDWLHRRVGERLVGTVRRCDDFATALAEGGTVFDLASPPAVLQDLAKLMGWMERQAEMRSSDAGR